MNFEGWIDKLENANLRDALRLRMARKFPEALAKLNLACDEGDGKALYFKYRAYLYGGWTLYKNIEESNIYYKKAEAAGCPWCIRGDAYGWGMFYLRRKRMDAIPSFEEALKEGHPLAAFELARLINDKNSWNNVMQCISFGDEETLSNLASEHFLIKAAEAKHQGALFEMAQKYYKDRKMLDFAYYIIESGFCTFCLKYQLINSKDTRELFIYGRGISLHGHIYTSIIDSAGTALQVYQESTSRAKSAVFCFVFVCRAFFPKDIRRMIGEMIWKSREDPAVWKITVK
jgi:hypothetical protein